MIATAMVEEVRRLLAEGKLSQRKISRLTGVSRGTVGAIAAGRRPDCDAMRRASPGALPESKGPLRRCPGCGGMAHMPCRLCHARAVAGARPRPTRLTRLTELDEPLGLDLRGEHRARYEAIRAEKVRSAAALSLDGPLQDGPSWCDGLDIDDDGPAMDPNELGDAFDWEDDESAFECAGVGVTGGEDGV